MTVPATLKRKFMARRAGRMRGVTLVEQNGRLFMAMAQPQQARQRAWRM